MNPKVPYFFLGLSAVLAASAIALLIFRPGTKPTDRPSNEKSNSENTVVQPDPIPGLNEAENTSSEDNSPDSNSPYSSTDPADLLTRIAAALEKGDVRKASELIGKDVLDPAAIARLTQLTQNGNLKLRKPNGVREIGELELNKLSRWAIELEDHEAGRDRILFDLRRENGKWIVDKITLPPAPGEPIPTDLTTDPLLTADAFLQAVLKQDFETALRFVDSKQVTDAKIAAICILFEEGEYRMRSSKPLRVMFKRPDTVGYIANVETTNGKTSAQFALNLRLPENSKNWLVSEINLDQLLADYAKRVADGDEYYSPLVKNPTGGETLALYFGFDEDAMSPRTRRQLEIVAALLKNDPSKKITLSGHTDALGTKEYNDSLSGNRATVVRDFLVDAGVPAQQIITIAKGASQPRRPNVTETGEDNPDGRRANRRTEIYLDF